MLNSARTRRRRRRKPVSLAVVLVCASLCLLAGLFERPGESPREARHIRTVPYSFEPSGDVSPVSMEAPPRGAVYPYSVIPGGAHDRDELIREVSRDPVVAAHYSDFNSSEARIVRVRDEKLVYVSYRLENRVFWTAKKVRLSRGEALITDGRNLARTRCGNRISAQAQEPTSPEEPTADVFDLPVVPEMPETIETRLEIGNAPEFIADLGRPLPTLPILLNPPDMHALSTWNLPYIPPIMPAYPQSYVVTLPGTSEVPEPGTLVLLVSGIAALVLFRRVHRRRQLN